MKQKLVSICIALWFSTFSLFAQEETYTWDNVIVGGGGYVTGIVIHPTEVGLMYMRTDIGGIFRWEESDNRWVPLFGWVSPDEDNLYGVDGIALDQNNPDIIYATLGKYPTDAGGIYKSYDRGIHWEKLREDTFASNMKYREVGENIAVDPNNSNVVYCGTRINGLIRSTNAGSNWSTISSVPTGYVGDPSNYWDFDNNPIGIRSIVIDPSSTISGRSRNIYAAVWSDGVYHSNNGGDSFYKMAGSPSNVIRVENAPGNIVYATTEDGIYKYNGSWQKLAVNPTGYTMFNGIDVDPNNSNNLIASTGTQLWWQKQYISSDAGVSWKELDAFNGTMTVHDATWHSIDLGFYQAATAAIIFDPHKSGRVYSTDWYQVWRTENIWETPSHWYNDVKGHEEIVVLALCTPHEGVALFSGQGDVVGFRHDNQNELPTKRLTDKAECTGIDYCETNPAHFALVSASDWYGANTEIFTSNDYGDNFTAVNVPNGALNGKIAMASNDPNKLVYVFGNSQPYYSTDGGNSWQLSSGGPSTALTTTYMYQYDDPLVSDRTEPNTFYLLDRPNGTLYKSTNGGQSWFVHHNSDLPSSSNYGNLGIGWGDDNNLMGVSLWTDGLWLSNNAGTSFFKINYFSNARMFSFGKAKDGNNIPSIYVYGIHNGQWGVYRSDDFGTNWQRINDDLSYVGNSPTMMKADRQTFGKVYVGTNGSGLFYGEISGSGPDPVGQQPYDGYPIPIPGKVEAEKYDLGGSGEAYNDSDSGNNGGAFRTDDVDIENSSQGGYNIGWTSAGEWLEYTVNVSTAGNYQLEASVASGIGGTKSFEVQIGSTSHQFDFTDASGWQSWQTLNASGIYLNSGQQILRVNILTAGINLDYLNLQQESSSNCSTNFITNPGFETGDLSPWTGWNNGIESNQAHLNSGTYGVGTWWGGRVEQLVNGLEANQQYYLTVWARNLEGGKEGSISVSGYGGAALSTTINSTNWEQYVIGFVTGTGQTSALIRLDAPSNAMSVADDLWLGCGSSNARVSKSVTVESSSEIILAPNPAENEVSVLGLQSEGTIQIYSLEGELYKEVDVSPSAKVNIQDLPSGIYIMTILTSGLTNHHRLVVK
ncbi:carbohydrate-binding protein [Sediminitomix flava]|uniref:Putative secreted protein (Por secretion system target) n=1 Tax=Sediminitomix flava TaxID=379075 RepID=A0A315YYX8_SEDFL|nr:carbohydrate-binding protein [Sediminitomix flava]PWJ34970.1 putative secreted protein (Por secretion system target) [Sediminitomix flava]